MKSLFCTHEVGETILTSTEPILGDIYCSKCNMMIGMENELFGTVIYIRKRFIDRFAKTAFEIFALVAFPLVAIGFLLLLIIGGC